MSFRIFASGTGQFHYERNSADEGDVYELGSALANLQSLPGSNLPDYVIGEAGDAVSPDSPLQQGLNAIGSNLAVHQIRNAVTMLAVNLRTVEIHVSARNPGVFVDTVRNAEMTIDNRVGNPTELFLRRVTPALEAVGLNRFTVLLKISEAISLFSARRRQRRNILLIQLADT